MATTVGDLLVHALDRAMRIAKAERTVTCIIVPNDMQDIDVVEVPPRGEPAGPYRVVAPARRTRHLRFDDLSDSEVIPQGTDLSSVLEADAPVVVQHSRLDSRQNANALLSTITFAESS